MTTPPQGPWGPGQPGGAGGQQGDQGQGGQGRGGWGQQPPAQGGGWGQRPRQPAPPQQPQQPYQPQHPPQQGRPPQQPRQGGGWGQQPQQPQQGGWGQRPQQPPQQSQQGGPYQQQSWGQQSQQQGGWHQQQGGQPGQHGQPQWQPSGSGGAKGPGGISKDKLPLVIGGGVVGIVLIGLLIFLGVHALGSDDEPEANPSTSQQPTGKPSEGDGENGELGNATGQAKTATEKLQSHGFGCSDLFNTGQGAHRGCFKYDGAIEAEAIFQFQPDGTITGVRLTSQNEDNINNAQVVFDQELQAIGNDTFGGDQVKKIQDAVKSGQKSQKVGSTWGEFQLRNDGDTVELSGGKSGSDSFDLPQKTFDTTEAQLAAALKTKKYTCTSSCTKKVGKYGQQRVYFYGSDGEGIKQVEMSASGDPADVKKALPAAVNDAFGALKGGDISALKSYIKAHSNGKSYASYVAGWRVEITGNASDNYASQRITVSYETFFV